MTKPVITLPYNQLFIFLCYWINLVIDHLRISENLKLFVVSFQVVLILYIRWSAS